MNHKTSLGGVIGLGKMGMLHSAIINVSENAKLCAGCEPNNTIRGDVGPFMPEVNFYKNHQDMM